MTPLIMRSQHVLANNDSTETITKKFEHGSAIRVWIGNR